jgi:hypothetical protein
MKPLLRQYRVSHEERSIFWEVIVSVILSKKLYMIMCPIPKGFRDTAISVVWLGRPVLSFPPALLREGRSIFWEVIVTVILSKKLYMDMCPIPNGFRDRAILVVWLGRPVLSFPPALLREGRSVFWEIIVSVILSKKVI